MSHPINVAAIQHAYLGSKQATLDKTCELITQAAKSGSELICLQELHCHAYFCQQQDPAYFDLAEPINGESARQLGSLAAQLNIVLVISLFEQRGNGVYHNSAIVFDKSAEPAGIYRKMHIPDDPGFNEKYYFTPGDEDIGFTPIQTSVGCLGVLICWDQWYPEAARIMALKGADILIYPTAIGFDPSDEQAEKQRQLNAWISVQKGHAVANHLPVIAINRIGHEPCPANRTQGIDFWGNSFICDAQGDILAQGEQQTEEILQCRLDLDKTEQLRRIWPFFRDRRIDAYKDILKRSTLADKKS